MPRIELRPNRWLHLPFAVGAGVLTAVFWKFGFYVPSAIAAFLVLVMLYRVIRSPAIFSMDSEGFSLNPAGVDLGRFRWSDVLELRDTTVITGNGGIGGPVREPALGVILKDPDEYMRRFPALLRPLFKLRAQMSDTPLLLEPGMFGSRYAEIVTAMRAEIARHQQKR